MRRTILPTWVAELWRSKRSRIVTLCIAAVLVTLVAVEHPSVRSLGRTAAALGFFDSQKVIVGVSDISSRDHVRGDKDSPVTILEYSDYGCTLCAYMQPVLDRIVEDKKVRVVTRHLYEGYDNEYVDRAAAAECVAKYAGEEEFFAYNAWLYENQTTIGGEEDLLNRSLSSGLTTEQFVRCFNEDREVRGRIRRQSEEAWRLGARGTPYLVVVYEDEPVGISYANQYTAFVNRIEALVAQHRL